MTQDKQKNPPDMTSVLDEHKRDIFTSMNCINVGIIQSFDASNMTAQVSFAIKKVQSIDENGGRVIVERPILVQCPIVVLSGGDSYVSFPISAGDECILLFNDREIDRWWSTGSAQAPQSPRAHDSSDAFALVGVRSLQNIISGYYEDGIRMQSGASKIDVTDSAINSETQDFTQTGDMTVDGGFAVLGTMTGNSGTIDVDADIVQEPGREIHAGNGANGTFDTVTVVDGIVISGS